MTDFETLREAMVEQQIRRRGIDDERILGAFRVVPREQFVDPALAGRAYEDRPLPIAAGQTISQPYVVALTIAAAVVGPSDRVLEVGAGSGYAAALLGQLARSVVAVERHFELAEQARARIEALGYENVEIVHGDGMLGWPAQAPFDVIVGAASSRQVPQALLDQLAPGGRMVLPVGETGSVQTLVKLVKQPEGDVTEEALGAVRFVPMFAGIVGASRDEAD